MIAVLLNCGLASETWPIQVNRTARASAMPAVLGPGTRIGTARPRGRGTADQLMLGRVTAGLATAAPRVCDITGLGTTILSVVSSGGAPSSGRLEGSAVGSSPQPARSGRTHGV